MVQRKLFLDAKSNGPKPENRFSNLTASQELKKKKMKMKRTRPTRLKDTGKPPTALDHETKTETKQSDAKVTGGSPNYMKGTSSSEARRGESVPRNVLAEKMKMKKTGASSSGSGTEKQSKGLCRDSSLKMTKTPSFKRCSRIGRCPDVTTQRATCSSTLKDSKFPQYLMLSPGATEAEGTSTFKVCPYTYCSLNGHLHVQYPPLKSFISSRRRALLKSQRSTKTEASSPGKEDLRSLAGEEIVSVEIQEKGSDGFLEIYVAEKNEPDQEHGFCCEGDEQVSESLSDGAPRSEIDSEESFGFYHDNFATKKEGPNEGFEAKEGEEYTPMEMDSESISETTNMVWDSAEMVIALEDGADGDGTKVILEQSEGANDAAETTGEVDEHQDNKGSSRSISGDAILWEDPNLEPKTAGEIIIIHKNDDMPNTPDDSLSSEAEGDTGEAFPSSDSENIHGDGAEKISFTRESKPSDRDPQVDLRKRTIECKKTVGDAVGGSRAFNPRDPNYLPTVPDPDGEKVDLKHQEIDERKSTEEWMIDYALQRTVSRLGPGKRKKKVALLVEAFETVMPVLKWQTHVKEQPSRAFDCGRNLQACN